MKKLLIVLTGLLCASGFVSIAWSHGPKAPASGIHSSGGSKFHFNRHSHPRKHLGRSKHHFRHKRGHQRHLGKLGRYWFYTPYYNTGIRAYGYQDIPPKEEVEQAPKHTQADQLYYDANPEPWFLYGNGKEFRQMGLIPPLSQTSEDLK